MTNTFIRAHQVDTLLCSIAWTPNTLIVIFTNPECASLKTSCTRRHQRWMWLMLSLWISLGIDKYRYRESLSMHWNSLEYTGTIWFQWFRIIRYSFISYELWFTESILRIKRNWRLRIMAQLTHVDYSYNSGHSNYQDFIFWQNLQCWWYKNFDLIDKTVNFATMMAIERMWLNA